MTWREYEVRNKLKWFSTVVVVGGGGDIMMMMMMCMYMYVCACMCVVRNTSLKIFTNFL